MAEIYLIRHGETDFNLRGIVQGGGVDSDLNDTGRMQGGSFFTRYGGIEFDRVYCTALKRTRQTLAGFGNLGHEIVPLPELNEFNWGILEGAEDSEDVRAEFTRIVTAWRRGDLHAKVEGGETPLVAWERARAGIEQVVRETPPNGRALICAHGRINRVLLSEILGYGLSKMDLFPHHNTGLNLLSTNSSGRFRIHKLNDTAHLQ
ncbi:MAG: histidine phosphatase family protein [Bacteroidia bacterium]